MQLFVQLVIGGIATGSIYALIALGYTMVYGIIELINFAHGDIFMIGTFVVVTVLGAFGISGANPTFPSALALIGILLLALIAATLVCAVLGVVIERIAYRPLRNAPRLAPLISAIGVSLIIENIGQLWKGSDSIPIPPVLPNYNIALGGGISISRTDVLVTVMAVILMIALQWLITRTRTGRAMRAVAQDREAAALMGVNVDRIIAITFFIGAGLAGAAAFIFGLKFPSTQFNLGFELGLIAFTAAVLGGIGNIVGSMLGGLVVGIVQALVVEIPDSLDPKSHGFGLPNGGLAWTSSVVFAILILILVFRPTGLLGQQTPEKV